MNQLRFGSLVLFVAVLSAGCGGGMMTRGEKVAALTGTSATGKTLYDANCIACHLADGTGNASGANIKSQAKMQTVSELATTIISGKGNMAAYGNMYTDQQLADIIAFVKGTFGN